MPQRESHLGRGVNRHRSEHRKPKLGGFQAAGQGHTAVVDFLLHRGADPSRKGERLRATGAVWTEHARPPRRALARVVAQMLEQASH
jgi:hypothetical protein